MFSSDPATASRPLWSVEASAAGQHFLAVEPTAAEVEAAAAQLAGWYNDEHNRVMMTASQTLSAGEVVEFYAAHRQAGEPAFFLYLDGLLVGDADLRSLAGGRGEFAIMIGPRASQGSGLGSRFASLIHHLAFEVLGLRSVYAILSPLNQASRRMFDKLGYALDPSPATRAHVEADDEIALSLVPGDLVRAQGEFLRAARCAPRPPGEGR